MAMSDRRKNKLRERGVYADRSRILRERSLDSGDSYDCGYWMNYDDEMNALRFMDTGDENFLALLPDYRLARER